MNGPFHDMWDSTDVFSLSEVYIIYNMLINVHEEDKHNVKELQRRSENKKGLERIKKVKTG